MTECILCNYEAILFLSDAFIPDGAWFISISMVVNTFTNMAQTKYPRFHMAGMSDVQVFQYLYN